MRFNQGVLIHDKKCFSRDALTRRLKEMGFNNLARMELFLWNLEIYLHIQDYFGDKVVLKGGAATQFYLPVDHQRTSVDIDMICAVDDRDILGDCIAHIEKRFNGSDTLFKFRLHKPENPKTDLPLLTYYMDVPSVCLDTELYGRQAGAQEIKIEFHLFEKIITTHKITSPTLFALETDQTYQILPLDLLIADKLTTLGPCTIGIPEERADEQIKQIYDIDALLTFNRDKFDIDRVHDYFMYRAKLEAKQRDIDFNKDEIITDMLTQMRAISSGDMEKNKQLEKLINDFQSLYLRKSIAKSMGEWAIVGAKIQFFMECFDKGSKGKEQLKTICETETKLNFNNIRGSEKGKIINEFKEGFIRKFGRYSKWQANVLKGKHQTRIFWAVISTENAEEICSWIRDYFG